LSKSINTTEKRKKKEVHDSAIRVEENPSKKGKIQQIKEYKRFNSRSFGTIPQNITSSGKKGGSLVS